MGTVSAMTTRYLADTHVLLWALHGDPRLAARHATVLEDGSCEVLVSIATLWEIAIKTSLGKLKTVDDLPGTCRSAGYGLLPVTIAHTQALSTLPFHHRDPFDRMLIVQGKAGNLTILTVDPAFSDYDVAVI